MPFPPLDGGADSDEGVAADGDDSPDESAQWSRIFITNYCELAGWLLLMMVAVLVVVVVVIVVVCWWQ